MMERLREHIPNDPKQTYGHTRALQVTSKVYGVNVKRPSPNIVSVLFINEDFLRPKIILPLISGLNLAFNIEAV